MATRSRRRAGYATGVALGLAALGLSGCNRAQVVQDECATVNGGDVCTWHEMKGDQLLAFGATIPMASVDSAPADVPMDWPPVAVATVPLGEPVKTATGFDVLTMFWEAHGHPPGPYLTPHFDFHFYSIPTADIDAIDCSDSTGAALPAGYVLPDMDIPGIGRLVGLCVPRMGMHALPRSEMEGTDLFQKTMVMGYYRGSPIFIEPMITRATLQSGKNFALDIPALTDWPSSVHPPQSFRADYDSTANAWKFAFSTVAMK